MTTSFNFIGTLEEKRSRDALEHVYGLLSGYIVCVTGHRKGVLTNLTVEEFATAEEGELERRIIRVRKCIKFRHIKYVPFHMLNVNR